MLLVPLYLPSPVKCTMEIDGGATQHSSHQWQYLCGYGDFIKFCHPRYGMTSGKIEKFYMKVIIMCFLCLCLFPCVQESSDADVNDHGAGGRRLISYTTHQ